MCGMRFQHTSTYDAPPDAVYKMLTDPGWRERVATAQGVVSSDVTITPDGEGCRVVVDQVQNTSGLPAIAKKIAGDTTRAVVTEVWASPTSGTVEILAPGKPTHATGTVSLQSDGTTTQHVTDLEVTVKVPLVGGRLENLMADTIRKGLEIECAVGAAWLEGER
jgi:carbon monoxide dehydrogenase subunit G